MSLPSTPPGATVVEVVEVQVSFTASGDVSDFQDEAARTSILSILASTAGLPVEGATLIVVSASVQITATFVVQDLAAATAAVSTFASAFGTASAATFLLTTSTFTVDVTTPPIAAATVRTVTLPAPSPPSQPLERWNSYVDLPTGCNASDTVNGSTALPGWPEECRFPDLCNITVNWSDEACENACKELHAGMGTGGVETWLAFIMVFVIQSKLMYAIQPVKDKTMKDKAMYADAILEFFNAVPMSWRFFLSATRAISEEMCLWPDPYTAGSWMALDGGGSFQVWVAAAVSPFSLQVLRHGILNPLQLWTAHFGSKAKEQPPYSKPFVVILLILGLPSLLQAGCSLVYFLEIVCMSVWMSGCTLVMLFLAVPIAKGTKHYYIRKSKKKEMWEKPLMIQYEIERDERMSCYAQYCGCMAYYGDSELRAKLKNEERVAKEIRREMSTAAVVVTALNAMVPLFIFLAMPLAGYSIWSLNLYAHYGWGLNYLLTVRETLGDRYHHFFETRLEFLFPDFFAFWNNLNITTIAGQLGLSILLDVVMLGLQMLPDWGRSKVGASSASDPVNV